MWGGHLGKVLGGASNPPPSFGLQHGNGLGRETDQREQGARAGDVLEELATLPFFIQTAPRPPRPPRPRSDNLVLPD